VSARATFWSFCMTFPQLMNLMELWLRGVWIS
jgi:hypothetical protein